MLLEIDPKDPNADLKRRSQNFVLEKRLITAPKKQLTELAETETEPSDV